MCPSLGLGGRGSTHLGKSGGGWAPFLQKEMLLGCGGAGKVGALRPLGGHHKPQQRQRLQPAPASACGEWGVVAESLIVAHRRCLEPGRETGAALGTHHRSRLRGSVPLAAMPRRHLLQAPCASPYFTPIPPRASLCVLKARHECALCVIFLRLPRCGMSGQPLPESA